jgi:phage terminase large subunit
LSFNPILRTHWIYKEYFKHWNDDDCIYKDDNLLIVHSTYKDNKFLAKEDILALENEEDKYYYEVYTLGKWGVLGAVIFKNWEMRDLSYIENEFDNIRNGLDFGYSNDPSAFIRLHLNKKKKEIYILKEIYQTELDNEDLSNLLKPIINNEVVFCDSAEPKSIAELKKNKIYAVGAKKGNDSVSYGIKFLQKYKIIIDNSCQNFKEEISKYKWKESRDGTVLPIPIDKDNHLLDGLRYSLSTDMNESEAILF